MEVMKHILFMNSSTKHVGELKTAKTLFNTQAAKQLNVEKQNAFSKVQ